MISPNVCIDGKQHRIKSDGRLVWCEECRLLLEDRNTGYKVK